MDLDVVPDCSSTVEIIYYELAEKVFAHVPLDEWLHRAGWFISKGSRTFQSGS